MFSTFFLRVIQIDEHVKNGIAEKHVDQKYPYILNERFPLELPKEVGSPISDGLNRLEWSP